MLDWFNCCTSERPIYGFYSLPPEKPGESESIELEAWVERDYMIDKAPYGISDPERDKRKPIGDDGDYNGPGLAIHSVELEGPLIEFPSRGCRLVFDGIKRKEIPPRNPRDRFGRNYQLQFRMTSKNETAHCLAETVRSVIALDPRPACLILNGDCALSNGREAKYKEFLRLVEPIRTAGITIHMTIGDHDNRRNVWKLLPFLKSEHIGAQADVIELPYAISYCWIQERASSETNS